MTEPIDATARGMSVYHDSREFCVQESTLRDRTKEKSHWTQKEVLTLFTESEETCEIYGQYRLWL